MEIQGNGVADINMLAVSKEKKTGNLAFYV